MRATKNIKASLKRTQRRIRRTRAARATLLSRKQSHLRACRARACSKVSHKLQALKNLIPASDHSGETVKPDQLFEETADYIILLRTQVVILQRLIEFYGSGTEKQNAASFCQ